LDTNRDILFRGVLFNDSTVGARTITGGGIGSGIDGSVVDSVDFSDVDVIQFMEKRSEQDGMDAGSVFLGSRRIRLFGTTYATSRALLFDALWKLRAAMSPVLAQRESPADKGYVPIYFSVPTNRVADYPAGAIDMRILVMPRSFNYTINANSQGGDDVDPLAITWQAVFIAKDPSIMGDVPRDYTFTGSTPQSGNTVNRGTYICPVDALWTVGTAAGSIIFAVGDSTATITIPASSGSRIIRLKGQDKMVTFEEGGIELPRMDRISFPGMQSYPMVPTGTVGWSISYTGGITVTPTTSHFWFWENYA